VPYMFHRDFNSSVRLNYNHWLMKDLSGYLLNPNIQFEQENSRIADVGTGTGIWLLELVDDFPSSATLDGFDISPEQYPPKEWIPKNVHLGVQDIFKPFPEEYLGVYDVVNLRFALCYVNNIDAEPLLKNLMSLLKPGGYLQWYEPRPLESQVMAARTSTSTTAMEQLAKTWHKPKPDSTYDWVEGMPALFEKHGLEVVNVHTIRMKDRHRLPWAHSNLLGFQDIISSSLIKGTAKEEELGKFMSALMAEFAQGVSVDTPFQCVVGKKKT